MDCKCNGVEESEGNGRVEGEGECTMRAGTEEIWDGKGVKEYEGRGVSAMKDGGEARKRENTSE